MSGFSNPQAPSAAASGAAFGLPSGSNTATTAAAATAPTPSSGVAFTPGASQDCMLYVAVIATTLGTAKITMGPSTGAEFTPVPVVNLVASMGDIYAIRVPAGWKVVATLTGVTVAFGACLAVPC